MKKIFFLLFLCMLSAVCRASGDGRGNLLKMSSYVRRAATEYSQEARRMPGRDHRGAESICAFVRIAGDGAAELSHYGCRVLERFGDIYIADIPTDRLAALSESQSVSRIEASEPCTVLNDTSRMVIGVNMVHEGAGTLPQAFTGKGVVVGVEDIGFDVTHPTFYSRDLSEYRVKRLWDQLSDDTLNSTLYVGRDYQTQEEILAVAHTRDGLKQTHGTHTAGTAVGSGYEGRYGGVAFESDICLIGNAVSNNIALVDSVNRKKYTSATDALGFKYAFDYADSVGKPCVVSFSEGSQMDLWGDDVLFFEVLQQMTGPGHIIVASAGNEGRNKNYIDKPVGVESAGAFIRVGKPYAHFMIRSDKPVDIRMKAYYRRNDPDTLTFETEGLVLLPDSELVDTVYTRGGSQYVIDMAAYPCAYDSTKMVYEAYILGSAKDFGATIPTSFEIVGTDAHAEFFCLGGALYNGVFSDPTLTDAIARYSVLVPGGAPSVVCVGATSYRTQIVNYEGDTLRNDEGTGGVRASYSSVGPTFYEGIKPDVMAPGTNVISSYSSYYLENNPIASDIRWSVEHFDFNGRTYAWTSDMGTSMSTPLVSGIIALWLQAKPDLTAEEVKEVFSRTCRRYEKDWDYPNIYYGHGEIDAYAGLIDILGLGSSIPQLSVSQPRGVTFSLHGDCLRLHFAQPTQRPTTVEIYSLAGVRVASLTLGAGVTEEECRMAGLARGVYAVQLRSSEPTVQGSTLVRL